MPTTRSTNKQTSLDDFKEGDQIKPLPKARKTKQEQKPTPKSANKQTKPNTSAKRKAPTSKPQLEAPSSKRPKASPKNAKQAQLASDDITDLEKPIMINRSPVLQLWGAVVTQLLHPDESWSACLSAGGAIASLCAVSKGKSIGAIEPKERSEEEESHHEERKEKAKEGTRTLIVMGFPIHVKGDAAVISGKPKPLNESLLIGKFGGEEQYQKAKTVMQDALESWQDDKNDLNAKAFHMYEKFRPNVAKGMSGWGRKGELNLHEVASEIKR